MLVPMWFGSMLGDMLIMTAWVMLPLLFRKASSGDGWMTRACLGVQIWRSRPPGHRCHGRLRSGLLRHVFELPLPLREKSRGAGETSAGVT